MAPTHEAKRLFSSHGYEWVSAKLKTLYLQIFCFLYNYELWNSQETSLRSNDTCKKFHNPFVTITYSVGSNQVVKLLCKNWRQRSSHSGHILCFRIKKANWLREFWGQNSTTRMRNYLNWLNQFVGSVVVYLYAENQHHSLYLCLHMQLPIWSI